MKYRKTQGVYTSWEHGMILWQQSYTLEEQLATLLEANIQGLAVWLPLKVKQKRCKQAQKDLCKGTKPSYVQVRTKIHKMGSLHFKRIGEDPE